MVLVMNLYNIYLLINNNYLISKLNSLNGVFLNDQDLKTESHRCILLYKRSRLWIKMMKGEKEKKDEIQIAPLIWGKGLVICNF